MTLVFLTGATGYLGKEILKIISTLSDVHLVLLVRDSARQKAMQRIINLFPNQKLPPKVSLEIIQGDLEELASLRYSFEKFKKKIFIHSAAALKSGLSPDEMYQTNVVGVRHVVRTCNKYKFDLLLHISTAYCCGKGSEEPDAPRSVSLQNFCYSRPNNLYEKTKQLGEEYIKKHLEIAYHIIRPTILVDSYDFVKDMKNNLIPAIGLYGWFQLIETAHRLAARSQYSHLRVAGLENALLDFMGVTEVSQYICTTAKRFIDNHTLPPETAILSGGLIMSFQDLITMVVKHFDLNKISIVPYRIINQANSAEKLYSKQGDFFVDYCSQFITFTNSVHTHTHITSDECATHGIFHKDGHDELHIQNQAS